MRLLLDTRILLWAVATPERLSKTTRARIDGQENEVCFSVASLWEIVIKQGLGRDDFEVDAASLRRGLLEHGFQELPVTGTHAVAVGNLPDIHRDPFDRMLIAQAQMEGACLLTRDETIGRYPGSIELV